MILGAGPRHIQQTSFALWTTFDTIWRLSGEKEIDVFYPAKRASLALSYLTTEVALLRNPREEEEHWKELETQIARACRLGNFGFGIFEITRFVLNTNYRILQSFYPEPTEHENPIIKE